MRATFNITLGDHHDSDLDDWQRTGTFGEGALEDGTVSGIPIHPDGCTYRVDIYPTDALVEHYKTLTPVKLTMSIVVIFIMITFLFLFYDRLVERRQTVIQLQASKTKAIVASLFPENVRDRLLQEEHANNGKQGFDRATLAKKEADEDRVIADLFPHCTVGLFELQQSSS
jgi:hypothetical protein